jgi:hypothetical protein
MPHMDDVTGACYDAPFNLVYPDYGESAPTEEVAYAQPSAASNRSSDPQFELDR